MTERMLAFRVEEQSFALDAGIVQEVVRMLPVARVPHAPDSLMGLVNLRGTVVPVLSMGRLLGRLGANPQRIIVVEAGETLGLAVDEADQLLNLDELGSLPRVDVPELLARHRPAKAERGSHRNAVAKLAAGELAIETVSLVAFAIGDQEFALPLAAVDEVIKVPANIALLPDGDDAVIGSVAVRGAVLALLSLSALLALPPSAATTRGRAIVVKIGAFRVGLVVDEMRSILKIPETLIDAVPQALSRGQGEARIQAICRLEEGGRLVSVLAPDHLLREAVTARLMEAGSSGRGDMNRDEIDAAVERFLLFRIGDDEFGIAIASVEEVVQLPPKLSRLPKAPAFVKGVMNLRGQVVPVIDQAQRFGEQASAGMRRRVIVVRIGDLQAGFIVDAVSEVVAVKSIDLQAAPDLGSEETQVFERVVSLDGRDRIVLIVSPPELLDRAEQDLLRSLGAKDAESAS